MAIEDFKYLFRHNKTGEIDPLALFNTLNMKYSKCNSQGIPDLYIGDTDIRGCGSFAVWNTSETQFPFYYKSANRKEVLRVKDLHDLRQEVFVMVTGPQLLRIKRFVHA